MLLRRKTHRDPKNSLVTVCACVRVSTQHNTIHRTRGRLCVYTRARAHARARAHTRTRTRTHARTHTHIHRWPKSQTTGECERGREAPSLPLLLKHPLVFVFIFGRGASQARASQSCTHTRLGAHLPPAEEGRAARYQLKPRSRIRGGGGGWEGRRARARAQKRERESERAARPRHTCRLSSRWRCCSC